MFKSENSVWTKRFLAAAIIQGLLAVLLTFYIVISQIYVKPEVSRVIAFGSAGMWFTIGYVMYIVVGVIGVATSALFYNYIENILGLKYKGIANYLALSHLLLMNIGIIIVTWLMMYGGYEGAKVMLPKNLGGLGLTANEAHKVFEPIIIPIVISIIILILGLISGGLGFLLTYKSIKVKTKQ
jgi:hypothetical protein